MTDYEALEVYAGEYVEAKRQESQIKKKVENTNASVKQFMELLKLNTFELKDGTQVCYSVTVRECFAEEKLVTEKKLIDIIKHFAPDSRCIKTKEYIDMDVLEGEIYRGQLSDDALCAMDSCKNIKEIPTLTIKKPKKGKK